MAPPETFYLDAAATAPVHPRALEAMVAACRETFGNPSSRHPVGLAAERLLRGARRAVAARLGCAPERLVFTSGGTEALALAILGLGARRRAPGHVLVTAVEHAAVLGTAAMLAERGHAVERVPVDGGGRVDPADVASRLRPETFLVAAMQVNNETGVVQPVAEVSRALRAAGCRAPLLVDAVQGFGHLPASLGALGAALVAVSGHKIGAPKGIGALALAPAVRLSPLWGGGDQEAGLRPGTENVPGIAALAAAVEAREGQDAAALAATTAALAEAAAAARPGAYRLGPEDARAPHLAAVAFPGLAAETAVNALAAAGVIVSSGSACHARRSLRSHVLDAMGVPRDHGVIRIAPAAPLPAEPLARACRRIAETLERL